MSEPRMATSRSSSYAFQSLKLVESPKGYQSVLFVLLLLFALIIGSLIFVPWQQSVTGHGQVTVFSPMERPQTIQSQIDARIKQWHVVEGQKVEKGQVLLELAELDTKFLDLEQLSRMKGQRNAYLAKRAATVNNVSALSKQLDLTQQLPGIEVPSARIKVQQAQDKLRATEENLRTAELNIARRKELYAKGLRSKRDLELSELDYAKARAENDVAQREATVAQFYQAEINAESMAKVQDVEGKVAKAQESIATIDGELLKLDIDISNMESRIEQRIIRSPIKGQVVRLLALGQGETVKEGDQLLLIVPETADQAVELYISDFNAPLVSVGRPVRIQFSGWPAIQFSGWPSIAVGTFGGRVAVVDAVDDGQSRYRVLVRPDWPAIRSGKDQPWPKYPYLRPGTQSNGWIMLDTVSLGFELWRQFNGFPPAIQPPKSSGPQKIKLSKKKP